jgi:hypothetical protein
LRVVGGKAGACFAPWWDGNRQELIGATVGASMLPLNRLLKLNESKLFLSLIRKHRIPSRHAKEEFFQPYKELSFRRLRSFLAVRRRESYARGLSETWIF